MTMAPETLAALRASIKHWRENLAAEDCYSATTEGVACALCIKFNGYMLDGRVGCKGCPVAEATGRSECNGSPYYPASDALYRWQAYPADQRFRDEWRKRAQAEVDFLISLLPEGETECA